MRTVTFAIALSCSLIASSALARDVDGMYVSDTVTLTGTKTRLTLNGAGMRAKFLSKLYVCALYLPQLSNNADTILQANKANRVTLFIVQDKMTPAEFAEEWEKGFSKNHTEQEYNALKPQIAQFNKMITTVAKDDAILLEYKPNAGTNVYINGKLKGTMPGKEFNQSLLKVWLGRDAIDKSLRKALLGGESIFQ